MLRARIQEIANGARRSPAARIRLGFAGPSRNSLQAAEALASQLGRGVRRVRSQEFAGSRPEQLSVLVSRLSRETGFILYFDDADALFGKRTGVQDAHDRYANQEVSYLLQNLPGIIVFACTRRPSSTDGDGGGVEWIPTDRWP